MMSPFDQAAEKLDLPKILYRIQFYASSDLGKESAENIEPMTDLEEISKEHNRVSEMKRLLEGDAAIPIDGIKDIRDSIRKSTIENSVLPPKELLDIAKTLQAARNLKSFIEKKQEYLPELNEITSLITTHKEIEFNIFQCIGDSGDVKDSASKQLRSIRQSIVDKQLSIRKSLERILKATAEQGMVQEEIVTTRDGRMVIPIKTEQKNKFPGFIHSASSSGHTVYIEPSETLTLNNEITELFFQEKREVEKILRELTSSIGKIIPQITQTVEALSHLDLCFAKARYSIEIKGNKPLLKVKGSLRIESGYHPVLLLRHRRESIVPLSVHLGSSYNTLLITGPNAGGKTVALKSLGIFSLMVQSGIHIPASPDSEFPIFKKIFVLIGDNQSIENDLSTYSSQVLQIKKITENADSESLVLIDEIGSNTDPAEGGAFAAAILKFLTENNVYTIATSHQAVLKAFVHSSPNMENGAMEFDQTTLLPTYRFKIGVPGSSYALEIADRLGVDQGIVSSARELLGDQKAKVEQLIYTLESRSRDLENQLKESEAISNKNKSLAIEYESKLKNLKTEIRDSKKRALEEAAAIVQSASSAIENTIKEIRDHQASKEIIKSGKQKLSELKDTIVRLDKELSDNAIVESTHPIEVKMNDLVVLKSGGQNGIVLTLPDKNGFFYVAFNSIKAKIHISNIESVSKPEFNKNISNFVFSTDKQYSTEVDIRGLFGEDAVNTVDKFLDDAVIAGLQRIEIIHGKGTGALRKKVNNFLTGDTRVKTVRLGELNEGGAGVTVVELKS